MSDDQDDDQQDDDDGRRGDDDGRCPAGQVVAAPGAPATRGRADPGPAASRRPPRAFSSDKPACCGDLTDFAALEQRQDGIAIRLILADALLDRLRERGLGDDVGLRLRGWRDREVRPESPQANAERFSSEASLKSPVAGTLTAVRGKHLPCPRHGSGYGRARAGMRRELLEVFDVHRARRARRATRRRPR